MRTAVWIIAALLVAGVGAPTAKADTCLPGDACAIYSWAGGTLTYDKTADIISATVFVDGVEFAYPDNALANSPFISPSVPASCGTARDAAEVLNVLLGCGQLPAYAVSYFYIVNAGLCPSEFPLNPCHLNLVLFTPYTGGLDAGAYATATILDEDFNPNDVGVGALPEVNPNPTIATAEPGTGEFTLIGLLGLIVALRKRPCPKSRSLIIT